MNLPCQILSVPKKKFIRAQAFWKGSPSTGNIYLHLSQEHMYVGHEID